MLDCVLHKSLIIAHITDSFIHIFRSSHQRCSMKKGVLRNFTKFTGKHLCQSLFFNKVAGLSPTTSLKKRLAQVFSFGFCKIPKNNFSYRTPLVAASAYSHLWFQQYKLEVSFNFVKQPFYGNSSLTHYHIVIYWVRCKIFSGKWGLKMNG